MEKIISFLMLRFLRPTNSRLQPNGSAVGGS